MLFRIEHAVRHNLTKPTSTSRLCSWNVPSGSSIDKNPQLIKDIFFDQAKYMKDEESKQALIQSKRKLFEFSPSYPSKIQKLENKTKIRNELYNILKEDIHGSCLWETMEGKSLSRIADEQLSQITC